MNRAQDEQPPSPVRRISPLHPAQRPVMRAISLATISSTICGNRASSHSFSIGFSIERTSPSSVLSSPSLGVTSIEDKADSECRAATSLRSEEHTSELQSLMRISYAVFCLKKKNTRKKHQ